MSKYAIFQIPLLSFYSTDLYRDTALNKKGVGFGYLFLLLAVCWFVLVLGVDYRVGLTLDEYAPPLISQFPTVTIIDGQASIEEIQPYYINDPETGEIIAIIDTTGSINSLEGTRASVLLTKTNVMFKKNERETRSFELDDIESFLLDQEILTTLVDVTKSYLWIAIYPFALVGSYIYRIIQVLIYAAFGLILASILKTELEYPQLLRLATVAVTPCIIINTFFWLFGISLPLGGFMFFILAMAYLFLGVKAVAEKVEE